MLNIVTMSASTAAYAAEAVKPSQRVNGGGEIDEAITLLDVETKARAETAPRTVARLRPAAMSLMFMSTQGQLPQGTTGQAISRYLENSEDIAPVEEEQHGDDDGSADQESDARPDDDGTPSFLDDMFADTGGV